MRALFALALFVISLLLARTGRAQNPCADDVKLYCADVSVGGGRLQDCLRQNEAKLSPACHAKRVAVHDRFLALVHEFTDACGRDAIRLCTEVKPGRGRVVACLLRQQEELSTSCKALTDRVQAASETVATIRSTCGAEVTRLCSDAATTAGPLVECLELNRESLSDTCRSVDWQVALAAAELVDAIDSLSSEEATRETTQILQGLESIAFSRSQILYQIDHYQGLLAAANANRFIFAPQLAFGSRREFAFQLRAPILAVYPYAPDRPAQTGLGAVTTSLAWGFFTSARVQQYVGAGLQWISPVQPPIGSAWAVVPGYVISVRVLKWLALSGQVLWTRSFASSGYPEVNFLFFDPIVVVNLPSRIFFAFDPKLGWNIGNESFVPALKGIGGLFVDRRRSLSISAWYQSTLSREAELQTFKFGVGTALAYFFDW